MTNTYTPPGKIKLCPFTVRPDENQHARLLAWIATRATGDAKRRAVAAVEAIERFLDSEGIPREREALNNMLQGWQSEKAG